MICMSLADDLRQAAYDVAAIAITQARTGTGGSDSERLARAAVEAAGPFLEDVRRVEHALALRQPEKPRRSHVLPIHLWEQAAGDEHRYLALMEEHGWLDLATMRVEGERG